MSVKPQYFPLNGSLDISSAPLSINPGDSLEAVNYIPGLSSGYKSIAGYERVDGQQSPSDAAFWEVVVGTTAGFTVGDTITGANTSSSAVIIAITDIDRLVVTALEGVFLLTEIVGGSTAITGLPIKFSANTEREYDELKALTASYFRDFIQAVPGEGPVRGVLQYLDNRYAFRDNVDGLSCDVYKTTSVGWQAVTLNSIVKFDSGSSVIAIGDVVSDGSSTATVLNVCKTMGEWTGSAKGYLVVDPLTGTGIASGSISVNGTASATCTDDQYPLTLLPGGRFDFILNNFFGDDAGYRAYGCDGINPAIEINQDGLISPLYSPDETDNPKFIQVHKNRLFLGFANSQVHYSVAGEPWNFTALLGAGQIGLGAEVTGMLPQSGGVLVLTTRRRTFVLEGGSIADFNLQVAAEASGAIPYTMQNLSEAYALDDRGIIQLSRTAAFGDFESGSISRNIQKLIDAKMPLAIASTVVRRYNQFWLFFSDGTGLACYPVPGSDSLEFKVTQINYSKAMTCICNAEDATGNERILFGSDDGFVYEAEKGTSFDGNEIERFIRPAFNHFNSPRVRKRWRKLILEIESEGPLTLSVTPDVNYSSPESPSASTSQLSAYGGGGYWDSSSWDEFVWDAETVSEPQMQLTGTGRNIGLLIHNQSAITRPYILQGVIIHYEPRRLDLG